MQLEHWKSGTTISAPNVELPPCLRSDFLSCIKCVMYIYIYIDWCVYTYICMYVHMCVCQTKPSHTFTQVSIWLTHNQTLLCLNVCNWIRCGRPFTLPQFSRAHMKGKIPTHAHALDRMIINTQTPWQRLARADLTAFHYWMSLLLVAVPWYALFCIHRQIEKQKIMCLIECVCEQYATTRGRNIVSIRIYMYSSECTHMIVQHICMCLHPLVGYIRLNVHILQFYWKLLSSSVVFRVVTCGCCTALQYHSEQQQTCCI